MARSPTGACSRSISATTGSSVPSSSGQGEDLVEELKVLLREQPEIGDRSRLGNEHIRPKAVFAA